MGGGSAASFHEPFLGAGEEYSSLEVEGAGMLRPQFTEALQHYREKGQSTVTPPRSHPSLSCLEAKQGRAWRALGWEAERGNQSRRRVGLGAVPKVCLPRGGGRELSSGLCALPCLASAEKAAHLGRPCWSGLGCPVRGPLPRLCSSVRAAQLGSGRQCSLLRGGRL